MKIYESPTVDLLEAHFLSKEEAYDKVPTVYYDIVLHGTNIKVGKTDLRLTMDDRMFYYGHIGYSIIDKYQGHHYALDACKILVKIAKDEYKMDKLIITCDPKNIASYKTLERLGCTYKGVEDVPVTHEIYWRGEKRKAIFTLEL